MKRLLTALALLCALAPLAGWAQPAPATPAADIQKLADAYASAWAKGDVAALAALHADTILRVDGTGKVTSGRAALEADFTKNFAGPWKGTTLVVTPGATVPVTADVAVSQGTYEVKGVKDAAGQPVAVRGSYFNTVVRRDGRWLLAGNATFMHQVPPPAQ